MGKVLKGTYHEKRKSLHIEHGVVSNKCSNIICCPFAVPSTGHLASFRVHAYEYYISNNNILM